MVVNIKVFKFSSDGKADILYKNSVEFTDGFSVPFNDIVRFMRLIYPKSEGVEFCIL